MGKIFCIGLNKTGTTSLHAALLRLGYRSLHNNSARNNENIRRAILESQPLLYYLKRDYDAYSDLREVTNNFDLADQQYPESKFILTVRDLDSWLDSRKRHVERNLAGKKQGKYKGNWLRIDIEAWKSRWHSHQQRVLGYFHRQPHKLLVLNVCAGQGYEPLCSFLAQPVPNEDFPWRRPGSPKLKKPDDGRNTKMPRS